MKGDDSSAVPPPVTPQVLLRIELDLEPSPDRRDARPCTRSREMLNTEGRARGVDRDAAGDFGFEGGEARGERELVVVVCREVGR